MLAKFNLMIHKLCQMCFPKFPYSQLTFATIIQNNIYKTLPCNRLIHNCNRPPVLPVNHCMYVGCTKYPKDTWKPKLGSWMIHMHITLTTISWTDWIASHFECSCNGTYFITWTDTEREWRSRRITKCGKVTCKINKYCSLFTNACCFAFIIKTSIWFCPYGIISHHHNRPLTIGSMLWKPQSSYFSIW